MPLLKKEPDLFPESLFELDATAFPWRVAHVRSRQEKMLARYLGERKIPFYLPLTEKKEKLNGRVRSSYLPLFTSYVFLRAPAAETLTVWRSDVIANLLDVEDQAQLESELLQLRTLQESGALLVPYPELTTGDVVKIREGVFKGFEGVIVREKGEMRLVISITMLRQSVLAEFGRESVAPIFRAA
jgi:transcriptional antiterminator RfaH